MTMRPTKSVLLSCSGSLAYLMFMGNAANANPIGPRALTRLEAASTPAQITPAQSCQVAQGRPVTRKRRKIANQKNACNSTAASPTITPPITTPPNRVPVTVDPNSDTVGDLAIEKFRCDCPPCRSAVMRMLQTGQLRL
jgi:hypothetical protein